MTELSLPAPAKLNLFLHITGQRNDGYHELQTIFQFVDFADQLTFSQASALTLSQSGPTAQDIPDEHNLIWKAARLLQQTTNCSLGAKIHVFKQIPSGGGLGGGSSDAATTLLGLNKFWDLNLTIDTLAALGQQLGADVPVFIRGFSAWAEGIGEQLSAVSPAEPWYLVLKPVCSVPTGEIFSHEELTRNASPLTIAAFLRDPKLGRNDCLPVVSSLYPEVAQAVAWLDGYSKARLTGTGACIFAEFSSQDQAKQVQKQVPEYWTTFVAKGLNKSSCHAALMNL